jgi:hypothetical protein
LSGTVVLLKESWPFSGNTATRRIEKLISKSSSGGSLMTPALLPTTKQIKDLFTEEITEAGGTVSDVFDDGNRLFVRSILPTFSDIRPGDRVQGGIALRTREDEILVHPYTFRQVCTNGAIHAQTLETRRIERVQSFAADEAALEVMAELREALHGCTAEEVFQVAFDQMRSALEQEADLLITVLPALTRLPQESAAQLLTQITGRFNSGHDRSRFGLMNAVTSIARDTRDPETRWRLEELGGGVIAFLAPVPKPAGSALVARRA